MCSKSFKTLNLYIKDLREKRKILLAEANQIEDSYKASSKRKKQNLEDEADNIKRDSFSFFYEYLLMIIEEEELKNISLKVFKDDSEIFIFYKDLELLNIKVSKSESISLKVSKSVFKFEEQYYSFFNEYYRGLFLGTRLDTKYVNFSIMDKNFFVEFNSIQFSYITRDTIIKTLTYYVKNVYKFFKNTVIVKKNNCASKVNPYQFFIKKLDDRKLLIYDISHDRIYIEEATKDRKLKYSYISKKFGYFKNSCRGIIPRLNFLKVPDFKLINWEAISFSFIFVYFLYTTSNIINYKIWKYFFYCLQVKGKILRINIKKKN